jgi:hypothetical protein
VNRPHSFGLYVDATSVKAWSGPGYSSVVMQTSRAFYGQVETREMTTVTKDLEEYLHEKRVNRGKPKDPHSVWARTPSI